MTEDPCRKFPRTLRDVIEHAVASGISLDVLEQALLNGEIRPIEPVPRSEMSTYRRTVKAEIERYRRVS